MKIAVCEDLPQDARALQEHLEQYRSCHQLQYEVRVFDSGESLLQGFEPKKYQIIFLDVYMGKLTGVDTARKIRQMDPDCVLIFTTTSQAHAVDGFAVQALHYLVKPVGYPALCEAMGRCRSLVDQFAKTVEILQNRIPVRIPVRDIYYVEAERRSCMIHTTSGVFTAYMPIGEMEALLDGESFVRCHRSFIVNLRWVRSKKADLFEMQDGGRVYISRSMQAKAKQQYDKFIDSAVFQEGVY